MTAKKALCGAKTRNGSKCKYQAGHGTDHVGTGKCRLHGGASKGAPKGNKNALKHGIYSKLFSDNELDEAKSMQGSIDTELAIARLQLLRLLEYQNTNNDNPQLEKIEESTIATEDPKRTAEKMAESWIRGAEEAGEEYDPDGDEEFFDEQARREKEQESKPIARKRVYLRRDFQNEYVRLTALIARLELQSIDMQGKRLNIEMIKKGEKVDDDVDQLTDVELDNELQKLVARIPI